METEQKKKQLFYFCPFFFFSSRTFNFIPTLRSGSRTSIEMERRDLLFLFHQ